MNRLIHMVLAMVLALLAAPAVAEPVRVTVTQRGQQFLADFSFPRAAPAWGFFRSSLAAADSQPWRPRSWRVLTPGVALQRRGKMDALVSTGRGPVPRRVRVLVTPFTGDLLGDYVPALALGPGSVALFDGQFSVFSVADARLLDRLAPGFDAAQVGDSGTAVTFRGRNLRIAGDSEGYRLGRSEGTYGLFGVGAASVRNGVATVVDSELPKWIADYIADFTPRAMGALTARLGPAGIEQPTVLASWEGPNRPGASMNGGTLKGLILMRFEGRAALNEIAPLRNMARWFIAHEASHFWLGQAVHYESPRDSWIMEGGADLLAVRTVASLDPGFDGNKVLNEALRDCSRLATRRVGTAVERNEHRAYYACGAVFALVAEKASGGDYFAFVRQLIAANRADRTLNGTEWLAALDRASGEPALSRSIRQFVEKGAADPAAALASLLKDAGIPFRRSADGVPQLP